MKVNVDDAVLASFVEEDPTGGGAMPPIARAPGRTVSTSRGRDNIVPCLECDNVYQALTHLEAARTCSKE